MDFFDNIFDAEEGPFYEHPVFSALFQSETRALQALQALEEPLSPRDSASCLRKAMIDCSPDLFRQVLEHSRGECSEQYFLPFRTEGWWISGHGSLLMLAAMMEQPRQAVMLLEHGYDCNGAGLALADYLRQDGKSWGEEVPFCSRFSGSAGCYIRVKRPRQEDVMIRCATPLAAALLCGSLQTAEVLLRQEGIWKGESSAVCRAAVMVLEGLTRSALEEEQQKNQLEILRRIFFPGRESLPDRETLLRSVYLQPASFVDFCTTRTLRGQLESGLCGEEDARQILEVLGTEPWWHSNSIDRTKAEKLMLLKRYFPKLCRQDWATGVFLREIVSRIRAKLPYQTLLAAWKQLCGKERDLTWMSQSVWALDSRELSRLLEEAGEGGSLIMDADSLNRWYGGQFRNMSTMLKRVQFRHRDREGVSGMMQHLMLMNDLRLMKQAVKAGLLTRENPKLLLECLMEEDRECQSIRAMILTYAKNQPNPHEQLENWKDPKRWEHWCLWDLRREEDAQELVRLLLHRELSREECLRAVFQMYQYLDQGVFAPDIPMEDRRYPTLQTDSLAGIACCAESGQMMSLMQELLPRKLLEMVRANWGEQFFFRGTPLALAAALGRTEQVRLLLESGVSPEEEGRGDVSRFFVRRSDFTEDGVPVTPLLAAILFGQEETAKLLMEAGAVCDFSRPEHRNVLRMGSAAALKLAEALGNTGFETISGAELETMRFAASEGGGKGVFWACLESSEEL